MINIIFFLLTIPLFAAINPAGGGNGGDVVVCPDRTQLLDYYEAELFNYKLETYPGNSEWEKAANILKKIEKLNPTRYRLYSEGLQNFQQEIIYSIAGNLEDIPDQGDIPLPRNCELKQIIIQAPNRTPETYFSWSKIQPNRYLIDKNLWEKLDLDHRAGLIIHELILREATNLLKHDDSRMVRKLNGYWSSSELSSSTTAMLYAHNLDRLSFTYTDVVMKDFIFFIDKKNIEIVYRPEETYILYHPVENAFTQYKDKLLHIRKVEFDSALVLKHITLGSNKKDLFPVGETLVDFFNEISFMGNLVSGRIKRPVTLNYRGQQVSIKEEVIVDANGNLRGGVLNQSLDVAHERYNLVLQEGAKVGFKSDDTLSFATNATGIVLGLNQDFFRANDAAVTMFPYRTSAQTIEGNFSGEVVLSCPRNEMMKVTDFFTYQNNFAQGEVKSLVTPLTCKGRDNIIYEVSEYVAYSFCKVIRAANLPPKAVPCEL